jgi:hypothetical protein
MITWNFSLLSMISIQILFLFIKVCFLCFVSMILANGTNKLESLLMVTLIVIPSPVIYVLTVL